MKKLRTLLVGYGAMGRCIAAGVAADERIAITHVLEMADVPGPRGARMLRSLDELDADIDCAVECAGHGAVKTFVPALLRRGIDVVLVSMGSLSEPGLAEALEAAAAEGNAQL